MAKIYEALECAEKEVFVKKDEQSVLSVMDVPQPSLDHETEEIMIGLYQGVVPLLPPGGKMVLQFVGSARGEGTSTVLRQFARTVCTKVGKRVLIIDADHEDPVQHVFFSVRPGSELGKAIVTGAVDGALKRVGDSELYLGMLSTDPYSQLQLFNSPNVGSLWNMLKNVVDVILIDSPPVNGSADGLAICRSVDGVILVLESERTRWPVAARAKERLLENGAHILGAVLNKRRFYIPRYIYDRL